MLGTPKCPPALPHARDGGQWHQCKPASLITIVVLCFPSCPWHTWHRDRVLGWPRWQTQPRLQCLCPCPCPRPRPCQPARQRQWASAQPGYEPAPSRGRTALAASVVRSENYCGPLGVLLTDKLSVGRSGSLASDMPDAVAAAAAAAAAAADWGAVRVAAPHSGPRSQRLMGYFGRWAIQLMCRAMPRQQSRAISCVLGRVMRVSRTRKRRRGGGCWPISCSTIALVFQWRPRPPNRYALPRSTRANASPHKVAVAQAPTGGRGRCCT